MSGISDPKAALESQHNSTNAFVTALAVNAGLLGAEVIAFLILKETLWRIYSPRAYLPPPDKRAKELPTGPFKWLPALLKTDSSEIIQKNGLDAYMFLRFLKLLIRVFAVFTFLSFVVIVPVDSVNLSTFYEGLEKISWTNIVDPRDQQRFAAHVVVVYVLTGFVLWMLYREMSAFVRLRHQFLLSPSHSKLAQARTVLITNVPNELSTEHDIKTFASFVPGGVDRVWLYRDTTELNDLFERRQELCEMLETAVVTVLARAMKAWRKRVKLHRKSRRKTMRQEEGPYQELAQPASSLEFLNELVPPARRPKHRARIYGLFGPKVDTIEWCKKKISKLNQKIEEKRKDHSEKKFLGSAFIRCNLQMGAHILAQCVSYHEPLWMVDRWMEAHPKDIVWANLDDGALEMRGRFVTSWMATFGLIIVWAFPVTFIGTLSNLTELCSDVPWLSWVCRLPEVVRGVIEGVFPPALLAGLFALLPILLRALAWYECIPRYSLISVSLYRRFYFFLLVHGFLIVTISSGITNALGNIIRAPTETVQELAGKLPGASVFFLTYMVTQGLAGAGMALAQLVPLVLHYVRKWLLGRTPRQAYVVTFTMPSTDFGTVLPRISLLSTITIAYSVISPLINALALISFVLFHIVYKFLLMQVFDQPLESETGGMYFPMAVSNVFVGLYIEHICLAALFFLRAKEEGLAAIIKGAAMLVLCGITAFVHLFMDKSFDHLLHFLPMSLATKKMAEKFEKKKKKKKAKQEGNGEDDGEESDELDLFSRKGIQSVRKRINKTVAKAESALQLPAGLPNFPALPNFPGKLPNFPGKLPNFPGKLPNFPGLPLGLGGNGDSKEKEAKNKEGPETYEMSTANPFDSSGERQYPFETLHSAGSSHSLFSTRSGRSTVKVQMDAPSPAVSHHGHGNSDSSDSDADEDDADDHAFDHPSAYQEQTWIWIPKDMLGLSELIVNDLRASGVMASDVGASMDEKGIVEVRRNPPDEEWTGGHDA